MTTPADPLRWARIADLFERALSVREDDRAAWLIAISGNDQHLHDEVASLLRVHQRAGSFMSAGATVASTSTAPAPRLPSTPLGPYRVLRVIGAGGMGVVYLAEDERLGRQVALKMVLPDTEHADRVEHLRREARIAAALVHPNIATVFALEEYGGHLFMVSEYVPGETLRDELSRGRLTPSHAVDTVLTIARALAVAHGRGVVHRDLKPENVVRTPDGGLKVLDFGLALPGTAAASRTADTAALGTPAYMSPEQIRGGPIDGRSDQFALGILLFELVTGTHPFLARSPAATLARILEAAPEPLRLPGHGHDDELVARIADVVERCLQKDPDHRHADSTALAAALERLHDRPVAAGSGVPHRTALWWWQFHQAAVAASYALLLIPLWHLQQGAGRAASVPLFMVALVAVVVAGALRLHLWFAARQYPEQWRVQHRRARRVVRLADVVFVLALITGGVLATGADTPAAALLIAAAVGVAVAFLIIEPATTRAAHGP